jgi:hypothetical protein
MLGPTFAYSCLLDVKPKFVYQLWVWVAMLVDHAGVAPEDVVVHIVRRGAPQADVEAYLASRGIAFRYVEPFGDGRFANKIAQLTSAALREREYAVLCDLDLAITAKLDPWIGLGGVCAKEVDFPNPPVELLEALYRRAGFDRFPDRKRCSFADADTFVTNCNGGVWILRTALFDDLLRCWERWFGWVMLQGDLLGAYLLHVTQISFSLAVWELAEPVVPLPVVANFPTHVPPQRYAAHDDVPLVLHYHDRITADGLLEPVGVPFIDARIAIVNERLAMTQRPAVFGEALQAMNAVRSAVGR